MDKDYKLYNITELKPGDHLCILYKTEEEHKALITPYLISGLENNEKIFYIVDARSSETVLNYLRGAGVDVDPYLESGQLSMLTVSESYMKGGVFDPDGMIKMLTEETDKALEEGYTALRVTGEMSWALRGLPGSERLIEYETKLNEFFPNNKALAICQYDCRVFEPDILLDILTTHPIAVIGTEIYENFYYIPTEDFLAGKAPEKTLKHWIENLKQREIMEKNLRENEDRYSITLDAVNDGLWDWNVVSGDAFFIPNYYKLLGYYPGEFPANYDSWRLLVHPEDIDYVEKELQESIKSGGGFEIELRMKTKSGEWLWVSIRGKAVKKDPEGNVTRMVGTLSDITERVNARKKMKLHQIRLEASIDLHNMVDASIKQIIDFVLEESLKITESKYAFIGLMSEDELVMTIHAWSKETMDQCSVDESLIHFPIQDAGIWGECVRQRKPIIINNYETSKLYKKGYPDGHVPIKRFIGVPIFDEDKIVVVVAASNKEEKYIPEDIIALTSFLNYMWRLIQRKNDEKEIKRSIDEGNALKGDPPSG